MNLLSFVWLLTAITGAYGLIFMSLEAVVLGMFLVALGMFLEKSDG